MTEVLLPRAPPNNSVWIRADRVTLSGSLFVTPVVRPASLRILNVLDGSWHHLVGVCDQANGAVLLYVNGRLSASNTIGTLAGIKSSSAPVSIGSRPSSSSSGYDYQFFGNIDEVAVYNSALSFTQVLSHYYAAGVAPRIVQSPTNTTVSEGASATFTAVAPWELAPSLINGMTRPPELPARRWPGPPTRLWC